MLSCRPDATCALGFAAAGRRGVARVAAFALGGKFGVTPAALANGETAGAIAALLAALLVAMDGARVGSWLTAGDSLLRATK